MTDASYIRVLDWTIHPERTVNMQIDVAGYDFFTVAAAQELAKERVVTSGVEIEIPPGMTVQQMIAVREEVGNLLFYVPIVHPEEYDVTIIYLVRRLKENSADGNFTVSTSEIGTSPAAFEKERPRFLTAVEQVNVEGESHIGPVHTQDRLSEIPKDLAASLKESEGVWTLMDTPDSDPAPSTDLPWARRIAQRIPPLTLDVDMITVVFIDDAAVLDSPVKVSAGAGATWNAKPAAEHSEILHRVGVEPTHRRIDLIGVTGSELGKSFEQADVEVSEVYDLIHYHAQSALDLNTPNETHFHSVSLTLVTPPWDFPLTTPAGGALVVLAAGLAAILKSAPQARRCGAFVAEYLWAIGVPKEVLAPVNVGENELGKAFLIHEAVERVILTGGIETAELLRSWDSRMRITTETPGKNAIVITSPADLGLAVEDVTDSALGYAGQKCLAVSYVILVGSVGLSKWVYDQLLDAVCSLKAVWIDDLSV